jgi:hypothetical protein
MQTPLLKNLTINGFLFLLIFVGMNQVSMAQTCLAYEKELEAYFLDYEAGDRINLTHLERTRWKCDNPTAKIDLIYYFFRSVAAIDGKAAPTEFDLENAVRFYNACSENFDYLLKENSLFVDLFFERAQAHERNLNLLAENLNYYPQDNYRYQNGRLRDTEAWVKRGMGRPAGTANQRVSSPSDAEFVKKFYHKGRYQAPRSNMIYSGVAPGPNGEFYGYVGDLSDLSLNGYFRWLKTQPEYLEDRRRTIEDNSRVAVNPEAARTRSSAAPYGSDWVTEYMRNGTFMPMVSIFEDLSIRTKPGKVSEEIDVAGFGEVVARAAGNSPVMKDGIAYIEVRNKKGNVGWVKQNGVVDEGQLAVFIDYDKGYQSLTNKFESNRLNFEKGELVVLEAVKGDWVKVVSKDEKKRGWVYGIESLSIDPNEIQIAYLVTNAYNDVSSYGRLVKLNNIKLLPGFTDADLASLVLEKIRETEQRGGFSFN